jgi:hypothetical protein
MPADTPTKVEQLARFVVRAPDGRTCRRRRGRSSRSACSTRWAAPSASSAPRRGCRASSAWRRAMSPTSPPQAQAWHRRPRASRLPRQDAGDRDPSPIRKPSTRSCRISACPPSRLPMHAPGTPRGKRASTSPLDGRPWRHRFASAHGRRLLRNEDRGPTSPPSPRRRPSTGRARRQRKTRAASSTPGLPSRPFLVPASAEVNVAGGDDRYT